MNQASRISFVTPLFHKEIYHVFQNVHYLQKIRLGSRDQSQLENPFRRRHQQAMVATVYGTEKNDHCRIKGKDKRGKWFTSPLHHFHTLDPRERGSWKKYLSSCLSLSRGVNRLHKSGLAHGDLSHNNVLIDPLAGGAACIIDIDELIVPNKFPPRVLGTPDFIAPEVVATRHLQWNDPGRKKPDIRSDLHALAVLVYQLLLYRHPLRGGKIHNADDSELEEKLLMGSEALFIEHPTDLSNRPALKRVRSPYLPWADVERLPYSITGPYLKELFNQVFIKGLHTPHERPMASDWELALIKTMNLLLPCQNQSCQQKWLIYNDVTPPKCPFCGVEYKRSIPVFELHSRKRDLKDQWHCRCRFSFTARRISIDRIGNFC